MKQLFEKFYNPNETPLYPIKLATFIGEGQNINCQYLGT